MRDMDIPKFITGLQQSMGIINHLGTRTTDLNQPLRDLLSIKNAWMQWGASCIHEKLAKPGPYTG
jgi:hypothetical protein